MNGFQRFLLLMISRLTLSNITQSMSHGKKLHLQIIMARLLDSLDSVVGLIFYFSGFQDLPMLRKNLYNNKGLLLKKLIAIFQI